MLASVFIGLASLIHFYTFSMESLRWGTPRVNKTFGMSKDMADANRLFAFNQGFYNLFLALGSAYGVYCLNTGSETVGATLSVFTCLSMLGAGLALLYSKRKLWTAALIQGLPPLLGIAFLLLTK
jgi:putative membrane protein